MIKELHKSALVANTKSEDKEQRTRRRAWTNWRILKGESKTKGLPGRAGKKQNNLIKNLKKTNLWGRRKKRIFKFAEKPTVCREISKSRYLWCLIAWSSHRVH
jgi:hypothetical protein